MSLPTPGSEPNPRQKFLELVAASDREMPGEDELAAGWVALSAPADLTQDQLTLIFEMIDAQRTHGDLDRFCMSGHEFVEAVRFTLGAWPNEGHPMLRPDLWTLDPIQPADVPGEPVCADLRRYDYPVC